jgi:hypothetical protein
MSDKKKMKYSWSRVLDGLGIVLLLLVAISMVHGAFRDSARLQAIIFASLCLLCSIGIYTGSGRVKRFTGFLFVVLAVGIGLAAGRFHAPIVIEGILSGSFLIVGILFLAITKTKKMIEN